MPSSSDAGPTSEKNFVTPEYVPTYFTNETAVEEARNKREPQPVEENGLPDGIEQ